MFVCAKFSSVRAYVTYEKTKSREKKRNVKEKETDEIFPFLFSSV